MNRNRLFLSFLLLAVFVVSGLSERLRAAYPLGTEVVFYHFEDAATATSTNSGSSATTNDGTLLGNASTSALFSKFGSRSGSFGETGDYMRTYYGNGVNPTTQSISVSLWAYKGSNTCSGDDDHIFGVSGSPTANRFYIRCSASKWAYRIQGNTQVSSTNNASTTGWDHIVLVANSSTDQATFYLNGTAQGAAVAYTSFTLPGNFYVGNYNDTVGGVLNEGGGVYIDDVAIYSSALSGAQVTELYQAGLPSGQVSSLTAVGYEQRVFLSWIAATGSLTDYVVEYKLSSEPTVWTTFNDGVSTGVTATVTGLTNGSAYDFRVTPKNNDTLGTVSATVSATPIVRVTFISPTPSQSSTLNSTSFTAYASSSLPSASFSSSTQTMRLETSGGALVSQVSTTTRYGDYNISHFTNITASKDMAIPSSASGAVYVPTTNTIFIPHNVAAGSNTTISEIDTNGDVISRTITCTACGDIEGITLISSIASTTAPGTFDHTFMISTENNTANGRIFRVIIPSTGNVTLNTDDFFSTGIVHGANTGLEGIAYNASSGVFYVAEEDATETLYEVTLGASQTTTTNVICSNLTWPAIVTDFSDLAYKDGILYVLTELAGSALIPVNITSTSSCAFVDSDGDGNTSSDSGDYLTSIPVGGTDQAEGVAFDATGEYLYVIGEADFFAKYRTNVFTTRHTFTGLADGSYVLKSSFLDTNGITSSSTDRAFSINTDVTAPTITNISSDKANGTYSTGEVIDIDVTFSEAVTSTGNVTVTLETGTTDRTCVFTVSNSTTGTCNYTVVVEDSSADLTVNSISGTIADQASNAMVSFTPATNLAANKALVIDAVTPPPPPAPTPAVVTTVSTPVIIGPQGGSSGGPVPQALMQGVFVPVSPVIQPSLQGLVIKNIMSQGKKSVDVKIIQRLLNFDKDTRVANFGAGSPGKETDLFGPATKRAVQKFQLKYGIVKSPKDTGYGVVGPKTKAKMNELLKRR